MLDTRPPKQITTLGLIGTYDGRGHNWGYMNGVHLTTFGKPPVHYFAGDDLHPFLEASLDLLDETAHDTSFHTVRLSEFSRSDCA